MILRPVAFSINNYKSISYSGICSFSGDGITVLAGQNEAGKTSVLQALKDFDGEPGKPPKLDDVVPDYEPSLTPSVTVYFSYEWDSLRQALVKDKQTLEPPIIAILEKGKLALTRDLLTGSFSFIGDLFTTFVEVDKAYNEEGNPFPQDELPDGFQFVVESDFITFLYQQWPSFVYFDSFDDLLPRRIAIDLLTKTTTTGVSVSTTTSEPEVPSAAKSFLSVAKISLEEVRRLAALDDDEKQLRNYLETQSRAISADFLVYWKQKVGAKQQIGLKAVHSHKNDGSYLLFYAEDSGVLHFPAQRSKGFLWFLSFYLSITSSAKGGQEGRGKVILIDEPGSFLHPKAQHDILDILEKRVVTDGNVVLYSTHSPYLLPADRLDRIRIAFKDESSRTIVADRLNDERLRGELRGDALAPIWNAIGIEIGELGAGPFARQQPIIIVEGITDYYYLHAWCSLLGNDLLKERSILVANGTPMIPYSASLAIAYASGFVILLDRDEAGNAAMEKLSKEMDINRAVIIQPHDAAGIEDVFALKDLVDLVKAYGMTLKTDANARSTAVIKKNKVDKVLLARKFSELVGTVQSQRLNSNQRH